MRQALAWSLTVLILSAGLVLPQGQPSWAGDPDIPQITVHHRAGDHTGDAVEVRGDGSAQVRAPVSGDGLSSHRAKIWVHLARWMASKALLNAGQ